jgi:hypothetical protein
MANKLFHLLPCASLIKHSSQLMAFWKWNIIYWAVLEVLFTLVICLQPCKTLLINILLITRIYKEIRKKKKFKWSSDFKGCVLNGRCVFKGWEKLGLWLLLNWRWMSLQALQCDWNLFVKEKKRQKKKSILNFKRFVRNNMMVEMFQDGILKLKHLLFDLCESFKKGYVKVDSC